MSLKLKLLTIRNFLGFGNRTEEIDLSHPGTILILGENIDRGGANGCGKSTIANAISYALYNKPLEIISKELLINTTNNSKKTIMEVSLEFEVDGVEYKIKRGRGADYDTKLYINGADKTPDSIDNVNKKIVEILGIGYELFRRTVVFRGGDQPFFEMTVSQQRALIEELFKITTLSEKAEVLKKLNQNLEKDIDVLDAQIKAQEKARDLHIKHIFDAEARILKWETDKEATVSRLKNTISTLSAVDFEHQETVLKSILAIDPELKRLQLVISDQNRLLTTAEKTLSKNKKDLEHLKDSKCPYCLQKFEDADAKIVELENEISLDSSIWFNADAIKSTSQTKLAELADQVATLKQECKYQTIAQLIQDKGNIVTYESQLKANDTVINPHLEAYESLLGEQEVIIDYTRLDELKSELEHQKFLLKLLIDKNSFIRKKIINKSIPFLNKQILYHSNMLGLPHKVSFNPDMSCAISEYGRPLDYGNLSGGERKRLNLALSMAFRDMLHHLHASINLLIVDEVDAGAMDVIGVEAIIRSIKVKANEEKSMGIWIISHQAACVGRFDREMTVRFENGFSSIDKIEVL